MPCGCRGATKEWVWAYGENVEKFRTEVEAKAQFYRSGEVGTVLPIEQLEEFLRQQGAMA